MKTPSGNPAPGGYGSFSHKCQNPEATAACGKEAMILEPSDMGRLFTMTKETSNQVMKRQRRTVFITNQKKPNLKKAA